MPEQLQLRVFLRAERECACAERSARTLDSPEFGARCVALRWVNRSARAASEGSETNQKRRQHYSASRPPSEEEEEEEEEEEAEEEAAIAIQN